MTVMGVMGGDGTTVTAGVLAFGAGWAPMRSFLGLGGVFFRAGGSFFSGGGLIDWSKNFLSTPWSQISCPRGAMPSSL